MSTDLTLPEQRAHRDELADRTEVLDRVRALRLLPGDTYASTELVAGFYGVDVEAVKKVSQRNRDELDADGFRVASRSEFERDIMSPANLDPRARSIALYPRRAILRVGMLLRDSAVARAVRDALLDAEQSSHPALDMTNLSDVATILAAGNAALQIAQRETARADAAEARVQEITPAATAWQVLIERAGRRTQTVGQAAAALSADPRISIGRNQLFKYLADEMAWLFRDGAGRWTPYRRVLEADLLAFPLAPDEETHWANQVMVRPKGFDRVYAHMLAGLPDQQLDFAAIDQIGA